MTPENIAAAFRDACHAELQALKPGNVHIYAGGHDMTVADFEASAEAAAPHIAAAGGTVGERILRAVAATRERAGQNTNLGIVLLCAPLAAAAAEAWAKAMGGRDLREAVADTLAALTRQDAALCFQAIALADPAGLGTVPANDVRGEARITLQEAMRLAADRDRVAYQYATGFADIFDTGLPCVRAAQAEGLDAAAIAGRVYWHFLTRIPDSHIARKYGPAKAEEIRALAAAVERGIAAMTSAGERHRAALVFDAQLKEARINPGTNADMTVATLFAHSLQTNFV